MWVRVVCSKSYAEASQLHSVLLLAELLSVWEDGTEAAVCRIVDFSKVQLQVKFYGDMFTANNVIAGSLVVRVPNCEYLG